MAEEKSPGLLERLGLSRPAAQPEDPNYALADAVPPEYLPPPQYVTEERPHEPAEMDDHCVLEPPEGQDSRSWVQLLRERLLSRTDEPTEPAEPEAPAPAEELESCERCETEFSRFPWQNRARAVCPRCQAAVCKACLRNEVEQDETKQKLCDPCHLDYLHELLERRRADRMAALDGFLAGTDPPPIEEPAESTGDKALRVAGGVVVAAKNIVGLLPLGQYKAAAKYTLKGADLCRKYGIYGIASLALRNDFVEAIEIIRTLTGEIEGVDMTDLSAGMFYFFAHKRGERGNDPDAEQREHDDCPEVSREQILDFLRQRAGQAGAD